jgi:hypothetical protein
LPFALFLGRVLIVLLLIEKIYILLVILFLYIKLIKYHTAIRSTMMHNNEKTIIKMTTVNSKLMIKI